MPVRMSICFLEGFFHSRSTSMKLPPKKFPATEKLRTSLGKLTDELMMLLTPIPKQTTTKTLQTNTDEENH